jgi:RNA polymerase-interacting CarD/CdnL/TRCF family regulator
MMSKKLQFSSNEYVVYPAHGVGKVVSIEEQEIAGASLELYVVSFEKDKMTLRVPTNKAEEIGMRSQLTRCSFSGSYNFKRQAQSEAGNVVKKSTRI